MPNTTLGAAAVVIDSRTLAERFKQHAGAVLQSGSTYVLAIGGGLVSFLLDRWAVMTTDQQTGLIGSLGITDPGTLTRVLTLVTLAVRFKPAPKGTVSPALQEALERIAAEQLNARLISAGRKPLSLPAPKLLAVTHEQLAAAQAQPGSVHPDDDLGYPETLPPPEPLVVAPAPPMPASATVLANVGPPAAVPADQDAKGAELFRQFRACYPKLTDAEARIAHDLLEKGAAP